jgi:GTPase SAR1 family protein/prophage antirepressor-like protein
MFKLADYTQKIADLKTKVEQSADRAKIEFSINENVDKRFHLVFVGQYSAGKSSILKAMTGREDIKIGAGITTDQVHTYDWSDIEVVDTPGIHTEKRPDHDDLSYSAIASADMLVYVVTNELFDSNLADHFRKLAIDRDKAGEMILVVNKMTRTAEGNTSHQQEIIRDDIKKVIEPYTPEQLGLCFMDANSYLKSLEVRPQNPVLADKLLDRSGYNQFVDTLNRFVTEKNLSSRVTTILYELDDFLQKASRQLEPGTADADVEALEENYMQQRHVLSDARLRLQQEIRDIYTNAASEIRALGLESADYLVEGCKKEDVEDELEKAVRRANDIIENSQETAVSTLTDRLNEMGQDIEAIENSEFTRNLKTRLIGRFDSLPDNIKKVLGNTMGQAQKAGNAVLKNAYNATAEGGLKLANFSGSNIHNIVLKAGHAIGYKFKPWQAIKVTKGIAIGGQVLSAFGIGLSAFMQMKSDQDEEKARADLKTNRQNIRSQFNSAANELEDHGRAFVKENIANTLDNSIQLIDGNIHEIRSTRANRSASCREMEDLHFECQKLIREIHSI